MYFAPFACATTYVYSGFTEIPKFAGIVQGVVVQMMNFASAGTTPFASLMLKAT